MHLAVFGLTISSSWGNGHATLWRGLARALVRRGHRVTFFERDVPYYATHRDLTEIPGVELVLYETWEGIHPRAQRTVRECDVAMVTSYCPDGVAATELLASARGRRVFYDLDTPVTLAALHEGKPLAYLCPRGLRDFDLALSFTGGPALDALRNELGAPAAAPLYGHVDPDVHRPAPRNEAFAGDLSYLGTFAADRQAGVEQLLIEPARRLPDRKFTIAGAQYPQDFPWTDNIYFVRHLAPADHAAFFSSSRLTLNVTREAMAQMGWCPSGRLFEAAACGVPIITDTWAGLDTFFAPGSEIITAACADDVVDALALSDAELGRVAEAARERVLAEHTSDHRALELELLLEGDTAYGETARGDTANYDIANGGTDFGLMPTPDASRPTPPT